VGGTTRRSFAEFPTVFPLLPKKRWKTSAFDLPVPFEKGEKGAENN